MVVVNDNKFYIKFESVSHLSILVYVLDISSHESKIWTGGDKLYL